MPTFEKVDYNPFSSSSEAGDRPAPKLERVNYDPFAKPKTPKRPQPQGFGESFSQGLQRSLPETKSLLYGAGAAAAGAVGADGLRDSALDSYREIQQNEVAPKQNAPGFREAAFGDGSLKDWAGDTLGNFAGQALQSAAAGTAGALIGTARKPGIGTITGAVGGVVARSPIKQMIAQRAERMVAEQMAKGATREAAQAAGQQAVRRATQQIGGATLAGTGLNVAQETGISFTGRAEDAAAAGEQLDQQDALRAIGAGAVAGSLDTAAEMFGVGRFLEGGPAARTLLGRVASGAAQGAAVEGGTEAAQAVVERYGAQRDLASPEAVGEYIDNAAAGALGGGVMGGAGSVRRPRAQVPLATNAEPAGPITQAVNPQATAVTPPPPRFDAAPGTLAHAANAIPDAPTPVAAAINAAPQLAAAAAALPGQQGATPRRVARPQPDMFQRMLQERAQPAPTPVMIGADGVARPVGLPQSAEPTVQPTPEVAFTTPEAAPAPEPREPSTPPVNMDPTTGEMLGADAEIWPAAAEHQQPGRIIEALVSDAARRRGRPPAIKQIAQTYNIDEGTARALRVEAVNRFTQQSLPQPAAQVADAAPAPTDQALPDEIAPMQAQDAMPQAVDVAEPVPAPVASEAPPADAGPVYDDSPDVLDTDITPPSGGAFESQGAAELAARRAGANARVMPVDGGYVVRTPAAPSSAPAQAMDQQQPTAADPLPPAPADAPAAPAVPEPQGAPAPSQPAAALPAALPSDPVPSAEATTPTAEPAPGAALRAAAAQAATSPENDLPEPTQAQKDAGNYRKGHKRINGLDISIENPAGSQRDPKWPPLANHYGYIKGTIGKDKDHVDVFMTDRAEDPNLPVFVVDQVGTDGKFDEHKVVMGTADEAEARATYLANYSPGWKGLGGITQMTQEQFKAWVRDPKNTRRPLAKQGAQQPAPPVGATTEPTAPALSPERYNARIVPNEPATAAAGSRAQADQDLVRIDGRVSGPAWSSATSIRFTDGRPARIYRGSADGQTRPDDFGRVGAATGHPSAGLGVWFSSDRGDASRYGQVGEYFLDIRNPKVYTADDAPEFDSVEEAKALRAKLINEGHDGIAFDFREDGGPLQLVAFRASQIHVERKSAAPAPAAAPAEPQPAEAPTGDGLDAAEVSQEELDQIMGQQQPAPAPAAATTRVRARPAPAEPAPDAEPPAPKTRTMGGKTTYTPNHPDTLKAYFVPGRVVNGYVGKDKVISLDPPAQRGDRWSVTVIGVDNDGNTRPGERERSHSTMPEQKELVAVFGPAKAPVRETRAKPAPAADAAAPVARPEPKAKASTALFSKAANEPVPQGLDMSRAQALKRELTKGWGENAPNVVLVETAQDLQRSANLPADVLQDPSFYRAEGLYNGRKTIWLNLAQLRTEQRFAEVLTHEALGHYGVERVVGAEPWADISAAIGRHRAGGTGASDVRAAIAQVERTQPGLDAETFAKEVIATMAEMGANNGLIRRVIAAVRTFLRKLMPDMSWSDSEIRALLAQAGTFLRSGRPQAEVRASRAAAAFSVAGAEMRTDGRGQRELQMGGERFVERSGKFFMADAKGAPRDFMALGEAQEAAQRVGGEVLADTPSEGDRPTWSVVAPAVAVRGAEVGGMATLYSKSEQQEARMPSAKMGKTKMRYYEHPTLGARVKVHVVADTSIPRGKLEIREDGVAILRVNPVLARDKEYINFRAFRFAHDFLWPYGDDEYVRVTDARDDYSHLKAGTHRGSINHATNEDEGGLSVARWPEFGAKYVYLVKGPAIGQGSDSEWLLNTAESKPVGGIRRFFSFQQKFRADVAEHAASLGVDERGVRALLAGREYTWDPPPEFQPTKEGETLSLFSKAPAGDVLKDIEAVMGVGNDQSAVDRARAALAEMVPSKIKDQFRGAWLGALTTRHLTELGADYIPNMNLYSDYMSEMGADRNRLQAEGEGLAEAVRKWAGKNAAPARALFDLMHESTIDGVDPSKDYQPLMLPPFGGKRLEATQKNLKEFIKAQRELMLGRSGDSKVDRMNDVKAARAAVKAEKRRRGQYAPLVAKWSQLTPEAQQFYKDMRDAYAGRSDAVEEALVARINDTDAPDNRKRQLINVIRQQFETHRLQGVYFPLQRFGQFFVAAERDGAQTFLMFERLTELETAVKNLRARGFNITAQGKKTEGKAKDAPSGTFVADVIEQLKKSGVSETTQDQIYQIYLEALPELSMRKHSIHRKAIPGFDPDAVRAFAFNMHHGAHQLARLRYSHKLQDVLNLMRDQQDKSRRDPGADTRKIAAGDAIIEELGKRHEWVMNPTDSAIASMASSIGFVYYLGVSPAAALVNLTQTALVSFPFLAARYGGTKAMNALLAAGKDSIRTLGNIQRTLTDPEEIRAHQVLQQMGAIDKTQAHNLAGIAENGLRGYSPAYARAMELIGWSFHKTEVVNRESTGIAAFRLARAEGKGFDEAVRIAADAINETHFDYTNANRARYMQSGAAKVLLMFRQYSLNMTWHLGRMLWQATKGESPEVKSLARRNLAGILGMSALFSGTMGLPMMGVVTGALNSIASAFGDDDEKWDAEVEFRAFLAGMFGETAAETIINGVANQLTGADIAGRVSLSQLWFRDADRELDGRGAYYNLLEQAAGPMGGILKNVLVGKQLIDEGHLWRGVETMLPKAIKDPVKSIRYLSEGVNTLKGDAIIEDLSFGQSLLQVAGFTPAELATKYDRNRALSNYEDHVTKRRQSLLDAYNMANRLGDSDGRAAAMEKIRKFNQTWPQIAITPEVLQRSVRANAQKRAKAENGIFLNEKIAARIKAQVSGEQ